MGALTMVLSPSSPRCRPVSAGEAQTLVKRLARMPAVARPHASIDLDATRGDLAARRKARERLSSSQQTKLKAIYFAHLKELHIWRDVWRLKVQGWTYHLCLSTTE